MRRRTPERAPATVVYLSGIASRTHLLHAAAFLRTLLTTTPGPVTLVHLGARAFLGTRRVSEQDLRRLLPQDDRLSIAPLWSPPMRPSRGGRRVYVAVGAPGIKPYLRLRLAAPGSHLWTVVLDEGLGSYGTWRTRRDAWRRQGAREPWPTIRSVAVTLAGHALTDERWCLYLRRGSTWAVNEPVAAALQVCPRPPGPEATSAGRRAVFLSQPWVEHGLVDRSRYREHLDTVAAAVVRMGLVFAVRPHPAEDPSTFDGFEVIDGEVPAELEPRVTSAAVVLGASSTALINLAALHGIPAVRITMRELDHLTGQLGPDQRDLLDTFVPQGVRPRALSTILPRLVPTPVTARLERSP